MNQTTKKSIFLLVGVLLFLALSLGMGSGSIKSGAQVQTEANSSQCGYVNGDISLTGNITAESSCFSINSSHVTVNCKGYTITYGTAGGSDVKHGVNNTGGWDNITIKNCVVLRGQATGANHYAIFLNYSQNSTIFNNTITIQGGSSSNAIYLANSSGSNISDNNATITTTGQTSNGVQIDSSSALIISHNTFQVHGGNSNTGILFNGVGNDSIIRHNILFINSSSDNNNGIVVFGNTTIENNTITINGTSTLRGIDLLAGLNLVNGNALDVNGTSDDNYGIKINNPAANTITNNTILVGGVNDNKGIEINPNSHDSTSTNNTIALQSSGARNYGINLKISNRNTLRSNTITITGTAANAGIYIHDNNGGQSTDNTLDNNTITITGTANPNYGIAISFGQDNILVNNNITTSANYYPILDNTTTETTNQIVYNNSLGQIVWTWINGSTNVSLNVGSTIFLQQNLVGVTNDSQALQLKDGAASLQIRGLSYPTMPYLYKNGQRCDNTAACNGSYDAGAGILFANVSSLGNYSAAFDTAPFVHLESPPNNTVNRTDTAPQFHFNASDGFNSTLTCTLWLNETSARRLSNTTNSSVKNTTSTRLNSSTSLNGDYTWWVNCSDGINSNISEQHNIQVILDTLPPVITINSPANNTLNGTNSTPEFSATATDSQMDILSCSLWLQPAAGSATEYGSNVSLRNATATTIRANGTLENSQYYWWMNCSDGVNANVSIRRNISFQVDTQAPQIAILSPANNTKNTTDATPQFSFNVTDNIATSLSCTLWVNNTTSGNTSRLGKNESVGNGTLTSIEANRTLGNAAYYWSINCSDGTNSNTSSRYNISIDITATASSTDSSTPSSSSGSGGGTSGGNPLPESTPDIVEGIPASEVLPEPAATDNSDVSLSAASETETTGFSLNPLTGAAIADAFGSTSAFSRLGMGVLVISVGLLLGFGMGKAVRVHRKKRHRRTKHHKHQIKHQVKPQKPQAKHHQRKSL